MPLDESHYPSDWVRIAEKDFLRVKRLLDIDDPNAAGFYLQQSVEKFLKAFLLKSGWRLRKIHDLEALLNEAIKFSPSLERYRSICQKISGFYLIERYPLLVEGGLYESDVTEALPEVEHLIRDVLDYLK